MTNFSFGRTDGRTERGNNNIAELSLESAGIIKNKCVFTVPRPTLILGAEPKYFYLKIGEKK